jgi:hypothetical protein
MRFKLTFYHRMRYEEGRLVHCSPDEPHSVEVLGPLRFTASGSICGGSRLRTGSCSYGRSVGFRCDRDTEYATWVLYGVGDFLDVEIEPA